MSTLYDPSADDQNPYAVPSIPPPAPSSLEAPTVGIIRVYNIVPQAARTFCAGDKENFEWSLSCGVAFQVTGSLLELFDNGGNVVAAFGTAYVDSASAAVSHTLGALLDWTGQTPGPYTHRLTVTTDDAETIVREVLLLLTA